MKEKTLDEVIFVCEIRTDTSLAKPGIKLGVKDDNTLGSDDVAILGIVDGLKDSLLVEVVLGSDDGLLLVVMFDVDNSALGPDDGTALVTEIGLLLDNTDGSFDGEAF